jgi:NAD(P)-dependent dehydrogenase (short-subunit alcohol dehydrogenase family)
MYDLSGDVALVTGAASGLGRATAERLAREGAAVALVDTDEVGLAKAHEDFTRFGAKVCTALCDVSQPHHVEAAITSAETALGVISVLVNNAGITVQKPYIEHSDEDFDRQMAVNLRGTHLFMSRALPAMVSNGKGAIVNIASVAALHYTVPHAAYAASKAGIIALSRDTAFEVASRGVRVNCVAPGLIAVPRSSTKVPSLQTQTAASGRDLEQSTSTRPLGYGRPSDIAAVVAFLVSDQARFVIGQTISVAGGTDLQVSMAYPGE